MVAVTSQAMADRYPCRECGKTPRVGDEVNHLDWSDPAAGPRCARCWRDAHGYCHTGDTVFDRLEQAALDDAAGPAARANQPGRLPPPPRFVPAQPPVGMSRPLEGNANRRRDDSTVRIAGACILCGSTAQVDRWPTIRMTNRPLNRPVAGPRCTGCTSLLDQTLGDVLAVVANGRGKREADVDVLVDTHCGRVAVARQDGRPDPDPPDRPWGW